jgi:diketogulonate reductase-like aldo/keto reductase
MLNRPIPSTGEEIPVIGLGTWKSFDVGESPTARAGPKAVLAEFVKLGGRLVDSSPMYGRAETVVGDLASELGILDGLFMATKVWTTGRAQGIAEMQSSMKKMRVPRMDLMQVHNLLDVDVHLATLAEWKEQEIVRYVGVTHYTASAHDDVARVLSRHSVDFLQINYSVAEREAEQRLLPMAQERGIAVIANRPLATGALVARLRARPLPPIAGELACTSWAQLLLKFVVSHPAMTCAIPATSNPEHLRDNMMAGSGPMPDEKQRVEIARLSS